MIISASDRHAVSPGLPTQQKLKFIPSREYLPKSYPLPRANRLNPRTESVFRTQNLQNFGHMNVYFFNMAHYMGQTSNLCFRSA